MYDCFLAQLLVLVLIFFCSARIFFLKNARVDCFAAFAPLALIISIFIFVCFGFSVVTLAVFSLSLLAFFTNFRAVLRLQAQLIVDSYSVLFNIFSVLLLISSILCAAVIIMFRPVKYSEKDFGIKKTQYALSGSLANLHIRESYFSGERFSGKAFAYEPVSHDEITEELYSRNPILIFSPGVRATVQNYEPYLMLLAQKGYKVLSADLYTTDTKLLESLSDNSFLKSILDSPFMRRAASVHFSRTKNEEFEQILEKEKSLATKKYSALTKLALEVFGDEAMVFYIVDNVDFDSIYAVIDEFNTEPYANAKGFFSMNRVDEYTTGGFGFIEQTDVLLAHRKGIERESKFFIPRYVANKTIKAIEEAK